MKTLILCLLVSVAAFSQAIITPDVGPTGSMFLSVGGSYNHYAPVPASAGTVDFGVKFAGSFYEISTLVLQPQTSSFRTGIGYSLKKDATGAVSVIALADGGFTTATANSTLSVAGVSLGNVGGGFLVRYALGKRWKSLTGLSVMAGFREAAVTSSSVQPEFTLKLSYYLK